MQNATKCTVVGDVRLPTVRYVAELDWVCAKTVHSAVNEGRLSVLWDGAKRQFESVSTPLPKPSKAAAKPNTNAHESSFLSNSLEALWKRGPNSSGVIVCNYSPELTLKSKHVHP